MKARKGFENMFKHVKEKELVLLGKYTLLWNAFERNFFHNSCCASAINKYVSNMAPTDKIYYWSERLKSELINKSGTSQRAIEKLNFQIKMLRNGKESAEANLKKKCTEWLNDDSFNLIAIFSVLYRIRCNTFHGNKEYISFAEQYDLFVIIINLLEAFLESVNANLDIDRT